MNKQEQKKLLLEIMEADARDGLYSDISKKETTQTAMQHLIKWLGAGWKDEDVESIIKKCNQLLLMEKEQIIEAYCDGFVQGSEGNRILSEEYYNERYKK